MKRKEGPHSRTTAKDDSPDWWISAHNDCLKWGIGVIVVRGLPKMQSKVEHIPVDKYKDLQYELGFMHEIIEDVKLRSSTKF